MSTKQDFAYLIINADDYGYYDCISKGIIEAHQSGVVTSTGIFANSPNLDKQLSWLSSVPNLDLGVHLNLTDGAPLSASFRDELVDTNGIFPNKVQLILKLLSGKISINAIEMEWRAQIEKCLSKNTTLWFLNSHEHIHCFPSLFKLFQNLADEYKFHYTRFPSSEWQHTINISSLIRNTALGAMSRINKHSIRSMPPKLLGLGQSGKLSFPYLKKIFSKLVTGEIYELMCHPGILDTEEVNRKELLQYHDWELEKETLTSPETKKLIKKHSIKLIGYRHLEQINHNLPLIS